MTGERIHSGKEHCENLDVLGTSAAELCRGIEVPVSRITEILNGRRAVKGCASGSSYSPTFRSSTS